MTLITDIPFEKTIFTVRLAELVVLIKKRSNTKVTIFVSFEVITSLLRVSPIAIRLPTWEITSTAVSYTHLDVYKRQVL